MRYKNIITISAYFTKVVYSHSPTYITKCMTTFASHIVAPLLTEF